MGFGTNTLGKYPAYRPAGSAPGAGNALAALRASIPFASIQTMAECPVGEGVSAEILLRDCLYPNTFYRGFDFSENSLAPAHRRLQPWRARLALSVIGEGGTFPLPDQSQDLFLCPYLPGRLRMDYFYMLCSEARRVVKPTGLWALSSLHPGTGLWQRFLARLASRASGHGALELNHFVSPEDWLVRTDLKIGSWGIDSQILVLERTPT
jgi:ubiquinone/menaquinone biosynthesis C-methylase UbiE